MAEFELPRLMIAAPHSGSGKTTLTIALLQAFKNREISPVAFKCGPDYIDPMFHREVLGVPGYNLDLFMGSSNVALNFLASQASVAPVAQASAAPADQAPATRVAVLEGVMGYYDGAGMTEEASSWHVARETKTPTVLVVRPGGASLSTAALIKGFLDFRANSQIEGVLLTDCSPAMADRLAVLIEQECGVKVYGYLPKLEDARIESRHLGLIAPEEVEDFKEKACQLAQLLSDHADIDGLLALAKSAPALTVEPTVIDPVAQGVRIGVARDEAFCFYYRENLELLEMLGAELVYFSPLRDAALPDNLGGLYLGGGYPELHAQELSANIAIREAIASAIEAGLPTIAECGGFLYLLQKLEDAEGMSHPMVGLLDGEGFNNRKLGNFGYVSLTAQGGSLLCEPGDTIRGHEFHYWKSTQPGAGFIAKKPHSAREWPCVETRHNLYAGFPHLYFWSNPECAARYMRAAAAYEKR